MRDPAAAMSTARRSRMTRRVMRRGHRAQVHPDRRQGAARRADPPRARARRRSRAGRARARRRAAARGSASTADELEAANAKGKLKGALSPRVQDRRDPDPRRPRRADRGGAATAPRSTGSGWRRGPGTLLTGSDKIAERGAQGHGRPAAPRRRRGEDGTRKLDQALARRRRRRAAMPGSRTLREPRHIVDGAGPRKCGTCRADRAGCRARASPTHLAVGAAFIGAETMTSRPLRIRLARLIGAAILNEGFE